MSQNRAVWLRTLLTLLCCTVDEHVSGGLLGLAASGACVSRISRYSTNSKLSFSSSL